MLRSVGVGGALAALFAAALAPSGAAAAVSGPDIVSYLNAQRAAQGVPAGIAEDAGLSDGCAKHNIYGFLNAVLSHEEDPSRPGYTPQGDQAGRTSVLYAGAGPWTATHNPFENSPIHLHQLLAPRIDRMGASENQGYGCATTLASRDRAAPPGDVTYTYPGDGATAWPAAQVAAEDPYTPGERVGIAANARTGPYLYVMFDGPDLTPFDTATATGADVTGPDGPIPVAVVDNHTSGLEGYFPTGLEIIPRGPLRANTRYTASIAANVSTKAGSGPARTFRHAWSFTTGLLANTVRITQTLNSARQVRVRVTSEAPGATVTATGPGSPVTRPVATDGSATINLDANGTWQLCARSGGGASEYVAAQDCTQTTVFQPTTTPTKPNSRPFTVSVPASVRHGATIRLTITSKSRFSLRFTLKTPGGRTVVRYSRHTLRGNGTSWTFRLRVPPPYNHRGRSVRLAIIIGTRGTQYSLLRRIRFR
jgi:hypothetical protein